MASERSERVTARVLQVAMVVAGAHSLLTGNRVLAATALLVLAIALAPHVVAAFTPFRVPGLVDVLFSASCAAHLLGHVLGLYYAFEHYDKLLHFLVGAAVAVMLHVTLTAWSNASLGGALPRRAIAFFTVALTALAAVVWEVGEFATDQALGLRNQEGLTDTMLDVTATLAAATLVAGFGRHLATGTGTVTRARRALEDGFRAWAPPRQETPRTEPRPTPRREGEASTGAR